MMLRCRELVKLEGTRPVLHTEQYLPIKVWCINGFFNLFIYCFQFSFYNKVYPVLSLLRLCLCVYVFGSLCYCSVSVSPFLYIVFNFIFEIQIRLIKVYRVFSLLCLCLCLYSLLSICLCLSFVIYCFKFYF